MKSVKILVLVFSFGLLSFSGVPTIINSIEKVTVPSKLVWEKEIVEVGQIPQGTPKTIEFEFKNSSDKSVIITNVKPACGCTTADYSKEPIPPGKSGFVKAKYNATALGSFTKTVTVTTNLEETPKVLTFKGLVVEK